MNRLFAPRRAVRFQPTANQLPLIYSYYRLTLAFLLLVSSGVDTNLSAWSSLFHDNPMVGVISLYLITCSAGVAVEYLPEQYRQWHRLSMLIVDMVVLTTLLNLSGGPTLQLSMLYLVVVVAGNLLLSAQMATLLALFAASAVIYQQFFYSFWYQVDPRNLSAAGLLAASFLMASLLAQAAARRLQRAEAASRHYAATARQFEQINQRIIDQMRTGVVVFDQHYQPLFSNQAARHLLSSRQLGEHISASLSNHFIQTVTEALQTEQTEVLWQPPASRPLGLRLSWLAAPSEADEAGIPLLLVWLEDMQQVNERAQRLKLASLGRLTASIAHEIRNPLAAVTQAVELLKLDLADAQASAQPPDPTAQAELLEMIAKQSQRMNGIINDILQLSRQETPRLVSFALRPWLEEFIKEFPVPDQTLELVCETHLTVQFDPDRLYQVVGNLVQNAMRHGQPVDGSRHTVQLVGTRATLGKGRPAGPVLLQVIDRGRGITLEDQASLFEPFFTTSAQGTGLGLYLSRALCEAAGAQLIYRALPIGSCFEIRFENARLVQ